MSASRAHDRNDRTSSYIPKHEIDEVEDDEIDTDFIDPRRSPSKIKQMAQNTMKHSKNERLKSFKNVQANNTNKYTKLYKTKPK